MLNSFWWGGGNRSKGIRWLAWERLSCPKAKRGIGFHDSHVSQARVEYAMQAGYFGF